MFTLVTILCTLSLISTAVVLLTVIGAYATDQDAYSAALLEHYGAPVPAISGFGQQMIADQ